ncbi:DUF1615 domain-containing protein [Luteimonas vadosa]|uniref:DUF1615 domain-containing protein n=1 Tax=Luteimonas vadosa TaxID=1165507 RepID=A0ABP9E8P8_9GAMM
MLTLAMACISLAGCERHRARSAEEVNASLLRKLPPRLEDRNGWARDVQAAFAALRVEPSDTNLCAALAVVEQESTYRADPQVPDLGRIAVAEIKRRAAARHIPAFVVDAALDLRSLDGRTYAARIGAMRTERELSELYEEMIARLPLGSGRVLKGLNPVRTGGPMQVSIDFAERHARGYPYGTERSIRHEVFTRRGGLYFGIKHLLDYPAAYDRPLYRFADFNAGRYASRNAAFQVAASIASGTRLARDGDLLAPGAPMDRPGATEAALRSIAPRLVMDDAAIRNALGKGHSEAFDETDLFRRVYAIADAAGAGNPVPRARVPEIDLASPKISRKLTTAWFAGRVEARWKDCLKR